MGAQHPVSLLVRQDLDQAVRVIVGLGSAVGHEGELAHVVLDALGLEVLLVLADPGHLLKVPGINVRSNVALAAC